MKTYLPINPINNYSEKPIKSSVKIDPIANNILNFKASQMWWYVKFGVSIFRFCFGSKYANYTKLLRTLMWKLFIG